MISSMIYDLVVNIKFRLTGKTERIGQPLLRVAAAVDQYVEHIGVDLSKILVEKIQIWGSVVKLINAWAFPDLGRAGYQDATKVYAYGRASSSGAKFAWLMVGQDFCNLSNRARFRSR